MVTGNVFFGLVLGTMTGLFGFSCKGAEQNSSSVIDTSILARSDQPFTIETNKTFYQLKLISAGKKFSGNKKLTMLLDAPSVLKNPDGVYELYVSGETNDVKTLSPSHPAFVTVLDLYTLTVSDPPNYFAVDLTKKAIEWAKDGQPLPLLNVTILFRGNGLPGKIESTQTGQMAVKGIRIVQDK